MNNSRTTLAATLVSLIVFFSIACKGQEQFRNKLLFEVRVKTSGQVTFRGEKVLLRVYEDGKAEADILSLRTTTETRFERKTISLSDTDFQEIQRLLHALERTDVRRIYLPNAPTSDLQSVTTILLQSSKDQRIEIVIEENATGVLIDRYGEKYPKAIIDLLRYVYELRRQFE